MIVPSLHYLLLHYVVSSTFQLSSQIKHKKLNIPVDLYRHPVAVAAATVFKSSSVPLNHDRITPKAEYITAIEPNVFAVALPFFIIWFNILKCTKVHSILEWNRFCINPKLFGNINVTSHQNTLNTSCTNEDQLNILLTLDTLLIIWVANGHYCFQLFLFKFQEWNKVV